MTNHLPDKNCFDVETRTISTAPQAATSDESLDNRNVRFTSLFGGDFYLADRDLRRYFSEPLVMQFLAITALIIVVYRSGEHFDLIESQVSPNLVFALEFVNALAVLTFLNALFYGQAVLQQLGAIKTVYLPLVTLPAACFIQLSTATTVWLLSGSWPEQIIRLTELSQDAIVILAFETLFARYVVPTSKTFTQAPLQSTQKDKSDGDNTPKLTGDIPTSENRENPAPDYKMTPVDEQRMPLVAQPVEDLPVFENTVRNMTPQDFDYVCSKGHYLHFVEGSRETTVRGNLRSVHEQLGTVYGIQINRSVWLSFHAVKEIRSAGKKYVVELVSGHEEKITDSRKLAVTIAYEAYQSSRSLEFNLSPSDGEEKSVG